MVTQRTATTQKRVRATIPPRREWRTRQEWTAASFRARSLELMATHGAGRWRGRGDAYELTDDRPACDRCELVWVDVRVESATIAGLWYTARYDAANDQARCGCVAGQRHQPCWHVGVALEYGRTVAAMYRGKTWASLRQEALDQARFEDNMEALRPSL